MILLNVFKKNRKPFGGDPKTTSPLDTASTPTNLTGGDVTRGNAARVFTRVAGRPTESSHEITDVTRHFSKSRVSPMDIFFTGGEFLAIFNA